jgi:hypothetical protein
MTVIGLVSNAMPARRFPAARRDMNTTVRLFYTFECSAQHHFIEIKRREV